MHYFVSFRVCIRHMIPANENWKGSAKNIFGTVLEKANEFASSTVETFNEQGLIGTLRNATSTAVEKSKEIIDNISVRNM